jgi:2-keto-4-pentenoate hydratase/2-oxohepta-3-ene-1,7-dioic acid hydratase in catechol pathway
MPAAAADRLAGMRIARFEHGGAERLGVVTGEEAVEPLAASVDLPSLLAAAPSERAALAVRDGAPLALADVRLLAPLQPATIRDFITFEEHIEGTMRLVSETAAVVDEWYEAPTFYFTNPHAVTGPHDDVPVPPGARLLDFELEVAAVIGRDGRDLDPAAAREHIAAYTIFNDWSARDLQRREMKVGLGPTKGKDCANTLGPWLVTADELEPHRSGDRLDLDMRVAVNGVEIGHDTLANMSWSFEEMVAYASRGTWVRAGDVLGSGTCGSGCLAEWWGRRRTLDPPPLAPGDVVTMTVEGIGTIANQVVAGVEPVPVPAARPPRRRPRPWD